MSEYDFLRQDYWLGVARAWRIKLAVSILCGIPVAVFMFAITSDWIRRVLAGLTTVALCGMVVTAWQGLQNAKSALKHFTEAPDA